jgi:hypothetical protein
MESVQYSMFIVNKNLLPQSYWIIYVEEEINFAHILLNRKKVLATYFVYSVIQQLRS